MDFEDKCLIFALRPKVKKKHFMSFIPKPFLKWAGGKRQLIEPIGRAVIDALATEKFTYVEPFVGSGAVLFWMLARYPDMKRAIINDVNEDLTVCYRTIATNPHDLIDILETWQGEFHALESDTAAKKHYYVAKRHLYNARSADNITQSALFIFLNRTCFNGLYRVNRNGFYNVPMGDYKKPRISDRQNILAVSRALQKVEIIKGDFTATLNYAAPDSFFYLDPPYKPLSQTANFTSYATGNFDDDEQIRLAHFCQILDGQGAKWLLSNSDVRGQAGKACFFDDLYADFKIERVEAKRRISAKSSTRGLLNELLIRNY